MKTKAKALLLSVVLSGASVGFAAPVQAHHTGDEFWPYYGLMGLILLDSYSSHHDHSKHRYYDHYRPHYKHRRHHSYGHHKKHRRHYDDGKWRRKHKHRRGGWDVD